VANETEGGDSVDTETVLDALGDPDCRLLLDYLAEPMTAGELTEVCNTPQSTTYRKLRTLTDAGLVEELANLQRANGASRYAIAFERVAIEREGASGLGIDIITRERSAKERLAAMWSQMREGT